MNSSTINALRTFTVLILLFSSTIVFSQITYVFFGSFNRDRTAEGLYVYQLDTITGNLTKTTSVSGFLNPSYLTLSPNGKYLYACTESKMVNAGSLTAFEFSTINKTLTFINSQKSGGENPVYLSVHRNEQWLVNGNYTQGSVSVYPIAKDGSICEMAQNIQFTEGCVNVARQSCSHIHSTVFSPDFDYMFFPDLGIDQIRCFEFNEFKKEPLVMAAIPFVKTSAASGPRHFTFHPNGQFAYCIEEISGTISVFSYNKGKLDSIQRINTHPNKIKDNYESSDIHISPDAKFLYASNRGNENNIAIFSIENDGLLKHVGYQSTFGKHPRVFTIDETGKFLIVTNAISGNVFVFQRDIKTGLLKKVGNELKIPNVSCVLTRRY